MKLERVEERLSSLEYSCGLAKVKPKVFQEIDDRFCQQRMEFQTKIDSI